MRITFTEKHITHYGGIFLIQQFCKKLGFKRVLSKNIKFKQLRNFYSTAELVLTFIFAIIMGLSRLYSTRILRYNGPFQKITGLKKFPSYSALRRFLLRLTFRIFLQIAKIHNHYRLKMIQYPSKPTSIIFDLDLTILTVYGRQEEAKISYNPHKRGRPSFYPLFCFESHTKDCWHAKLRSGKPTGKDLRDFLEQCFTKLPSDIYRVRARGDTEFFKREVIEFLEENKANYTIVAPSHLFKNRLGGLQYRQFRKNWWSAEFYHQPAKWKKKYRFVVIRRPVPEKPEAQLTLFTMKKYAYQVLITNLTLLPESIYRFYLGRCSQETYGIKELKWNFSMSKIPTRYFLANEIYFHLNLFAYNIVNWFKRVCLPKQFQKWTLQTIRTELLMLPARLVKPHGELTLRLPTGFIYRWVFDYAIKKIQKLKEHDFYGLAKKSKTVTDEQRV